VVGEAAPAVVVACIARGRVAGGRRAAARLRFGRKGKEGREEFLTARRRAGEGLGGGDGAAEEIEAAVLAAALRRRWSSGSGCCAFE
jgi:hypothetical protein